MNLTVQGRTLSSADLKQIQGLIARNPGWRRQLSQALCEHWDWRNGAGRWKDMAPRKDIYLYPLHRQFRARLCA